MPWFGSGVIRARACRSDDRPQYRPAEGDEPHQQAEDDAHNDRPGLALLRVHPDEHQALRRQERGGGGRKHRVPAQGGRDDQADHAEELEEAQIGRASCRERV